jgi:hypothetical protein
MQPNRKNAAHDLGRRLDMYDPSFGRPRPEPVNLSTLANGYREVLMPYNLPVRCWSFVEENTFYRETF